MTSQTTGPNSTVAVTTSVSGSSFVIFQLWESAQATPTISDTINGSASGNTYTQIGTTLTGAIGGFESASAFLCTNGNGGVNHVATSTFTGTNIVSTFLVEITGGVLTSLTDQISSPQWNDDVSSPFTSNAITTTQANELILALALTAAASGTETLTWGGAPSSFTQVQAVSDGSNSLTGGVAKLVVSSTGSVNSSFTSAGAGTTEAITMIVSFKAAAGSTFALSGQSITSSEGTIARAVTYGLTAQTATFSEGTITASTGGNVTLGLTAQTATFTEGALSLNLTYSLNDGTPLTGQTATFAEGTPVWSVTYGLTAQTATFSEGVLTGSLAHGLTGQTGTFTEGTITPNTGSNVSKGLTGQTATFAEGTLTPSWGGSAGLTAQTATFTEGQINASAGYAATGQSATFAEGTLGHALGYAVAGLSAAFAEGIISRNQTGPVTIGLTATQAMFALGIITPQVAGQTIRVQAIYDGTYGGQFYEAGDVFDITSTAFSNNAVNYGPNSGTIQLGWMIQVTTSTPLYQARTSGQSSIGTWLPPNDGGRRTVY